MNVKAIPSVDKSHIEGKRSATGDSVAHQTVRASGEFAADAGRRADLAEIFPCRQPSQDNQPICLLPHAGQYQRGREKIDNVMIAPKSDMQIPLPTGAQGSVTFQTVNDYGALTSATTASLG